MEPDEKMLNTCNRIVATKEAFSYVEVMLAWYLKRVLTRATAQQVPITPDNSGQRITEMLMECAERLGNFPEAKVDPRSWQHLLVYAPAHQPTDAETEELRKYAQEVEAEIVATTKHFNGIPPPYGTACLKLARALLSRLTVEVPSADRTPDSVERRSAEWASLNKFLDEYINDYEMLGEDDEGRDGYYTPTEDERNLLHDCIEGLLADDEFVGLFSNCYPVRSRFIQSAHSKDVAENGTNLPEA